MNTLHSLIVPIHNGSEFIHLFWHSLLPNLLDDSEIILVDDGSKEDVQRLLPQLPSDLNVHLLRNDTPQGYARAVNRGLASARGDFIYLLNTDLILGQGALALINRYLRSDESIGVVGAKLLYPQTGRTQHFGLAFTPTRKFHIFTHMAADHPLVSQPCDFQAVTFALCGMRRALIERIGDLDSAFCNGSEDIDFCLRAGQAGYRNVVPSEVASYHWESLSGEGARHLVTLENEARFWGRWSSRIHADIGFFVGRSLEHFLCFHPHLRSINFTVINLSPGMDFNHIIAAIGESLPRAGAFPVWDYSRAARHGNHIWLSMTLPFDTIRAPQPFLLVAHEFPQLLGNHYWFATRLQYSVNDLIVDHYGNVLHGSDSLFLAQPSRQKSSMDAS